MQKINNVLIGSHVSMSGPDYFLGSVTESLNNGANTLMIYTGAPQNSKRVDLEKCKINDGIKLAKKNNMATDYFVCHAPYIINLANFDNIKFEFATNTLINEIKRCEGFKIKYLVLHPGSNVNCDKKTGLNNIAKGLNIAIKSTKSSDVIICLETMAGKGNELGSNFDEIKYLINLIEDKNRIGVCLDTCHINDAGYDVSNIDNLLNEFDTKVGLQFLKVIHLNDSKNNIGSHKDRHANIGCGTIGFANLLRFVYHQKLENIPKILETPYINGISPYKKEIEMILNKTFIE